jgi:putative membrane protein
MREIAASAAGLPAFLVYFAVAVAIVVLFAAIYIRITPMREVALIRDGKLAPAISFCGALVGFALPLSRSIEQSGSMLDLLLWSLAALVIQLIAFFVAGLVLPQLGRRIAANELGAGVFAAAVAITFGLLNSASMTY